MKTQEKPTPLFSKYSSVTFPIIVTFEDMKIVYKNETAMREFPMLRKGSSLLKYSDIEERGEFIKEKTLFGKNYFVSCSKFAENKVSYRLYYFIETFFSAESCFTKIILDNTAEVLKNLSKISNPLNKTFVAESKPYETIHENCEKVRKMQNNFSRFLHLSEHKPGTVSSCGLYGIFSLLQRKLGFCGIDISFDVPKLAFVKANYKDLAFIILNIVQFALLFAGEKSVKINVSEKHGETEIIFTFSDKNGIISAYESAISVSKSSDAAKIYTFAPLFCAMTVLKQYKRKIELKTSGGVCSVSFSLKQTYELPLEVISSKLIEIEESVSSLISDMFM